MAAKMTKKSATAFRTISEVAEELEVQQHVLRFWETKFTQVKPLKRGGGRRYYRPEDVALLKKIHHLLYTEGYTIKGVQKLMKGQGKQQLIAEDVAEEKSVANESAVENRQVSSQKTVSTTEEGMSGKQRAILQAMLGDLKELRDMIKGK
ncbi:MAG: MerR family transcriptional regulator [Alphaproteobacteria bacterium CG_4_9_14_3_um_filter_47_13]|nr:MAG: MerR family transcriptional regulator [Alphaproteobacteria bacterium CG_4_9_14_3_um_filter_47_13]